MTNSQLRRFGIAYVLLKTSTAIVRFLCLTLRDRSFWSKQTYFYMLPALTSLPTERFNWLRTKKQKIIIDPMLKPALSTFTVAYVTVLKIKLKRKKKWAFYRWWRKNTQGVPNSIETGKFQGGGKWSHSLANFSPPPSYEFFMRLKHAQSSKKEKR